MKKRVHEIAKQQGLTSKEVLAALNAAGIEAKVAASSVEEDEALKVLAASGGGSGAGTEKPKTAAAPKPAAKTDGDGKTPEKAPAS
ncbi:MAG: translation initiation factor IF-2 N-terminal domain-containing protein, partial [Solirubrobacterales bacterium]